MRDPHGLIIREISPQPPGDLLGTPGGGPAPVLAARLVPARPMPRHRSGNDLAAGRADRPGQPVLHVLAQLLVRHQPGGLRAGGPAIAVPLRNHSPVDQRAAPGARVAPQLPRRPSTASGPAAGRSPGRHDRKRGRSRSPPAQRTTGNGPNAARTPQMVASRHPRGTTGSRPPATRQPRPQHPHSTAHARSPPRTADRCSRRATGGRPGDRIAGRPVAAGRPVRSSPHLPTSRSRCCDDRLNPPWVRDRNGAQGRR